MNDRLEQLLTLYETGVDTPDSSGLEHLDLLLTRSVLANASAQLSSTQNRPHPCPSPPTPRRS